MARKSKAGGGEGMHDSDVGKPSKALRLLIGALAKYYYMGKIQQKGKMTSEK